VVEADGSFRVTIDPPQLNGQTLSVTQADSAGNDSPAALVTAPDLEAPEAAQGLGLDPTGTELSGQGEPGSTVEVRNAAGDLLGTIPVNGDGTFTVTLTPAQTNGEVLSVRPTTAPHPLRRPGLPLPQAAAPSRVPVRQVRPSKYAPLTAASWALWLFQQAVTSRCRCPLDNSMARRWRSP